MSMNRAVITISLMAACLGGCSAGEPLTSPQGDWSAVNAGQPPPADPTAQYPVPLLPPPVAEMPPQAAQAEAAPQPPHVLPAPAPPQDHEIHLDEASAK